MTDTTTDAAEARANLAERIRAAVTYQYMPMQVRKLLSEAAQALATAEAASGAGEREGLASADNLRNTHNRAVAKAGEEARGYAAKASGRFSDEDEALYTRWLTEDETLTISRAQHLRFQARIDRETKERAR